MRERWNLIYKCVVLNAKVKPRKKNVYEFFSNLYTLKCLIDLDLFIHMVKYYSL